MLRNKGFRGKTANLCPGIETKKYSKGLFDIKEKMAGPFYKGSKRRYFMNSKQPKNYKALRVNKPYFFKV